jgi:hypothetical protein
LSDFGGKEVGDFWKDKDACWKLMDCPEYVYKKCPAYSNSERPCWEVAYTQCEILISILKDCKYCKVYRLYSKFSDRPMSKV